jgi:hypothetical protein
MWRSILLQFSYGRFAQRGEEEKYKHCIGYYHAELGLKERGPYENIA